MQTSSIGRRSATASLLLPVVIAVYLPRFVFGYKVIYLYFYGEMAELFGSNAAVDVRNSASEIDMKWLRKSQLVEKKYEKKPRR